MKICAAASRIATAFERMGHTVLRVPETAQAVFDLPEFLKRNGFVPDLVFQQESLNGRVLLAGLERVDCPRIFWSVDTHLNLSWHRHYARLFDGIMTPHLSILRAARLELPPARRLAWPGAARPWTPFARRSVDAAFVGRLARRPVRGLLVDHLREIIAPPRVLRVESDISSEAMMALYADARLAPNESILGEVNFRLVEAASAGCLVLGQEVGEDQDALFAPGGEIEICAHALELRERMERALAAPAMAEAKARAAWERVQREHLPAHRAAAVLDFAAALARGEGTNGGAAQGTDGAAAETLSGVRAATGPEAGRKMLLAMLEMARCNLLEAAPATLADRLADLPPAPDSMAGLLDFAARPEGRAQLPGLAGPLLVGGAFADDVEVNLAGSMAGLLAGDWDTAKQFWYRHQRALRPGRPLKPETARDLCLAWAEELTRAGKTLAYGGAFSAGTDAPRSAAQCLEHALRLEPADREAVRRLDAALSTRPGLEYTRLGRLSDLTLRDPDDWRVGLALALVNLKVFRARQGLEELRLAREAARRQGREAAFVRALRGMDPGGAALRALAKSDAQAPAEPDAAGVADANDEATSTNGRRTDTP